MTPLTKTIFGYAIALEEGRTYRAARPFARSGVETFAVTIYDITDPMNHVPVMRLPSMTYDEANGFLAAFNCGPSSFEGRRWQEEVM